MPRLRPGHIFEYIEGERGQHEVVRVTPASAVVRPLARRHAEIKDIDGDVVAEFDAPGRVVTISVNSMVRIVGYKEPPKPTKKKVA